MRQVMIDKPHSCLRRPELLREFLCSTLLMPHAQEVQRRIQAVEVRQRHFPCGVALQIVPVHGPRRLPPETHFVYLLRSYFREVQTRSNGVPGKPGIVLQPADALFRHRKQQFAVAHDARRRIMHLRIANSQGQHRGSSANLLDTTAPRNRRSLTGHLSHLSSIRLH